MRILDSYGNKFMIKYNYPLHKVLRIFESLGNII